MSQIRVISSTIICPTSENDELTHRVELTPWDLRLLKLEYIQKGLPFQKPAEKGVDQNLIQHLKVSLSRTLDILHPLAGRLSQIENEDGTTCFFINCNSAGAQFVHAAHDGVRVADILDPVYIPDEIIENLFSMNSVLNYEGTSKPLLAVQVTELADGIFIGCSINHAVADGTSFWHFFNTWSLISRSGSDDTVSQSTPVFGRHFLDGLIDLPVRVPFSQIQIQRQLIQQTPSSNLLQRVFHFPKEKVAQLKAKANAEMSTSNISSLQALMAHLWRATTRGRCDLKSNEEITYRIAIGLRQKMKPPLPDLYMGNALRGVSTYSTASDLLQHGLGWAALKINKAISAMRPEDVTRELEDWVKAPSIRPNLRAETSVHGLLTGSSPRFNVYGNDFGWGRPVAVRSGSANKMNGKLTVFPGAEEGSIDFEVCLLPETLHAMENDAEFMEAVLR
ncbi:PREDICTED: uncharacterized acetyltransferase At3g50280-like [Fragaria vesca subsp. vesca]|uniref:uncharacterized acetyltransferase At3g50280-like n=1 Tax=Fragaria vesca subsp. vesca TaxID=101020 RepID=UPI0002C36771|nr:PREDICTED: uncharacterized acetyltransferase At3g50280-like [Fragaria vesca subsp. vesca]